MYRRFILLKVRMKISYHALCVRRTVHELFITSIAMAYSHLLRIGKMKSKYTYFD